MKFCSLASGSSGNCQFIEHNDTRIIVDAGLSGKKIKDLLDSIDVDIDTIDGIFVTHEHIDHIKGVGVISRRHNLDVFTNRNTYFNMINTTKEIKEDKIHFFENEKPFDFKDIHIEPMNSFHDCSKGSVFTFSGDNKKISVVTDTGYIDDNILTHMEDSDLFYIEANHDKEMLIEGFYPWSLKERIMSSRGHLSNNDCANILKLLLKRQKEVVMLAHLSKDNNTPTLATRTIRNELACKNINEGTDYILEVAKREGASEIYKL